MILRGQPERLMLNALLHASQRAGDARPQQGG
jgi:hypothetical protein